MYIYTVFRRIFKSYRKFALLVWWIWEVYVWKKYRVHTVAVIATHCVSIAILCCYVLIERDNLFVKFVTLFEGI